MNMNDRLRNTISVMSVSWEGLFRFIDKNSWTQHWCHHGFINWYLQCVLSISHLPTLALIIELRWAPPAAKLKKSHPCRVFCTVLNECRTPTPVRWRVGCFDIWLSKNAELKDESFWTLSYLIFLMKDLYKPSIEHLVPHSFSATITELTAF